MSLPSGLGRGIFPIVDRRIEESGSRGSVAGFDGIGEEAAIAFVLGPVEATLCGLLVRDPE